MFNAAVTDMPMNCCKQICPTTCDYNCTVCVVLVGILSVWYRVQQKNAGPVKAVLVCLSSQVRFLCSAHSFTGGQLLVKGYTLSTG